MEIDIDILSILNILFSKSLQKSIDPTQDLSVDYLRLLKLISRYPLSMYIFWFLPTSSYL